MSLLGVPDDALEAARWIAWQAASAGRLELAQRVLDGLAVVDPRNASTAVLRAEVALRRGDAPKAHEAAGRALQIAPRDPAALLAYGRALLALGEVADAQRWLGSAAAAGSPLARVLAR